MLLLLFCASINLWAQAPVANFTANKISGCSPLTVQFTSTSTGSPTSFLWNFGNSNTSILQNPSATYIVPGTYTVSLRVTNSSGTDTRTQTAYITVYSNPISNFSATPLTGCNPLLVSFTDLSVPGSGTINTWSWDFGNGQTSSTRNPTCRYLLPGTYTVTLSVKDVNGCEHALTKTAYIVVSSKFTANFSAVGNISCTVPATVNFTSGTNLPGTYTYLWKFGDGGTSTLANPNHAYTTPGNYDVEVEITNSTGCKQTIKATAFAQIASLKANFNSTQSTLCAPAFLNLINTTTSSTGVVYNWKLNGTQDYYTNNTNYVLISKTNIVTLIAKNTAGCIDTVRKTFILEDRPEAEFVTNKDTFCATPATVNFTDTSTGSYNSWAWNFGNSQGSALKNPSITYTQPGTYEVRLIVSRGGSCKDTATRTIYVSPPNVKIKLKDKKGDCIPNEIEFEAIDSSLIPLTNWKWELNNTIVSTQQKFKRNLLSAGRYVFKLTASNDLGCSVILYDTVWMGEKPKFTFTASKRTMCYSDRVVILNYVPLDSNIPDSVYWLVYSNKAIASGRGLSPFIVMPDTGWFHIKVTLINKRCVTEIDSLLYFRVNGPKAGFEFKIDTCNTDTVNFLNLTGLNNNRNKFVWDFNRPGGTSTQYSPTYVYLNSGTHIVKLVATDTVTGCKDSIYKDVRILYPAKVDFSPLDTAVCLGSTVTFKNLSVVDSSRQIVYQKFQLTDTRLDTLSSSSFAFQLPGVYGVTLTIKDNLGCTFSLVDSATVKVYGGKAGFTMTPSVGCTPLLVSVNDTSKIENPILNRKWKWNTFDSTVTIIAPSSFLYVSAAPIQNNGFPLTLTVTDIKGCMFTATKNVYPTKPKAEFTVTSVKTCGSDSVALQATVSNQTVFNPPTYRWTLPKGNPVSQNTKIIGTGDTTYNVKLVLTDGLGCKDSITKSININTLPPAIGFIANPRYLPCYKTKTPINFVDTTKPGGSPIAKRIWDIGDGRGPTQTLTPTYSAIYNKPGKFDATLTVTDSVGCTSTLSLPEFINAGGPLGSYTFNPRKGCNPLDVTFNVSSPNAVLYIWDHADGNVDSFATQQHTYLYNRDGVYYPRLTLVDSSLVCDFGLDIIDSITVHPLPKPDFEVRKSIICKGNTALFSNKTPAHSYPILLWKWRFSHGDSSLLENPGNILFDTAGIFAIELIATDANGCIGKTLKPDIITVKDDSIPPAVPFIYRATVLNDMEVLMEHKTNTEIDFDKYIIYTTTNQYNKENIDDTTLTEANLNTLTTAYSYKMVAVDVCRNTSEFSPTHTTVNVEASPSINSININWSAYEGFGTNKTYEVWRKKPEEPSFKLLVTAHGDSLHYTDTNVLCYQPYIYRIKTIQTDGLNQYSWSDTSGATPIYLTALPIPQNKRVTVVNNRLVRLEWYSVNYHRSYTYEVYRAVDSGAATLYKTFTATDSFFVDANVDVQKHNYTYTTYVIDACGGRSEPSNVAKTILLNVRMVGNDILTHDPKLTWNAYEKWPTRVHHYDVTFYYDSLDAFSIIARNSAVQLEQTHKYVNLSQADYCYIITAYSAADTSITSESNIACVSTQPRLYAPNVFTRNNDGINDLFFIRGIFITDFKLQIFNRWGQKVFETTNMNNGWDGTFNGENCPSDVYVYVAEGKSKKGDSKVITGNVTLLR